MKPMCSKERTEQNKCCLVHRIIKERNVNNYVLALSQERRRRKKDSPNLSLRSQHNHQNKEKQKEHHDPRLEAEKGTRPIQKRGGGSIKETKKSKNPGSSCQLPVASREVSEFRIRSQTGGHSKVLAQELALGLSHTAHPSVNVVVLALDVVHALLMGPSEKSTLLQGFASALCGDIGSQGTVTSSHLLEGRSEFRLNQHGAQAAGVKARIAIGHSDPLCHSPRSVLCG
mmetsp:Transcript_13301/g.20181  ORF Transcript_13301/g.20181 Transcript_13301/m.20181 type:complete len:229 (-) Transcript_13301:578-1264(-)